MVFSRPAGVGRHDLTPQNSALFTPRALPAGASGLNLTPALAYRGCQKNVPIEDRFSVTNPYAAILFSEHYYDKRYNEKIPVSERTIAIPFLLY
jgi:hypothetical protein